MPSRTRSNSLLHSRGAAACTLMLAALAMPALAQQKEFKMGDDGSWVKTREVDPASDEGRMQRARQLLAENRPGPAKKQMDDWIEKYEHTDSPWLSEAYLIRGDARTAMGDEYNSLYDYEEIVKGFPGTEQFATAVEREMDIGMRYLNGLKRKFLGMRIDDATILGEDLLIRTQERLPGSRIAERACIELADYYYRTRDLKMAATAYDIFLKNYPNSQYRQKAMQRRVYSNIGRFKGPLYDGSGLLEAKLLINDFSESYPADAEAAGLSDALVARLDESAAAQMLETTKWYLGRHDPVSARLELRRLLRKHPDSVAAVRALELIKENGWDAEEFKPPVTPPAELPPEADAKAGADKAAPATGEKAPPPVPAGPTQVGPPERVGPPDQVQRPSDPAAPPPEAKPTQDSKPKEQP